MILLRFTCLNHRSMRDEANLSLVSSTLKTARPANGDWASSTVRVAGVYGPNASGKSNLLDAIWFANSCIRNSATTWAERPQLPHHPFQLNPDSRDSPSMYSFDFVEDGVRYEYGFEISATGVESEWLNAFPSGRRRVLFERSMDMPIQFGRSLGGQLQALERMASRRTLFLSTAALGKHRLLRALHHALSNHIQFAQYSDSDRSARIRWVMGLLDDEELRAQATNLLRFADLGISAISVSAELESSELDEPVKRALLAFNREVRRKPTPDDSRDGSGEDPEFDEATFLKALRDVSKSIRFSHGPSEDCTLDLRDESSGTIAWLSLAVPALQALKKQTVLLVDELDASMHPRLTAALVAMFKDPRLNTTGAQLVFTSHDATLLGHLSPVELTPDEVWFCQKDAEGNSELISLAEFTTRIGDNFERRYLQGRYGALPIISPDELIHALQSTPDEATIEHAQ